MEKQVIPPALSAEEWARGTAVRQEGTAMWPISRQDDRLHIAITTKEYFGAQKPATLTALIATANDLLPDGDSRKITHLDVEKLRETVRVEYAALRHVIGAGTDNYLERIKTLADVLESYLPPERG